MWTGWLREIPLAFRNCWNKPVFTLMVVVPLALGIGANTALFSAVQTLLIRSVPYQHPDRLVRVWEDRPRMGANAAETAAFTLDHFRFWREDNPVFAGMAAYGNISFNLTGGVEPLRIDGYQVSPEFFRILGVEAAIGRVFVDEEETPGEDRVVIIAHGLWQRLFGGDTGLVGRDVQLDGVAYSVVGIMPPDFRFPDAETQFWVPLPMEFQAASPGEVRIELLPVIAKLKPGVAAAEAEAHGETFLNNLRATNEMERRMSEGVSIHLTSLEEQLTRQIRAPLWTLFAAVVFVLLIACANVANLLLVRSLSRRGEMAVRSALGASRSILTAQVLAESLVYGLIGGAMGLFLAWGGLYLIGRIVPQGLTMLRYARLDLSVLAFTLAASIATSLVVGMIPATRSGRLDLVTGLKGLFETSYIRGIVPVSRLRQAFAVVQVAVAVILLIGAGLLIRSFLSMTEVDNGYEPQQVITAQLNLPASKYPDLKTQAALYESLRSSMASLPSVTDAGLVNLLPISGSRAIIGVSIEGRPPVTDRSQVPRASLRAASTGYFAAMGIPLRRGRVFDETDRQGSPPVVIINEAFARTHFSAASNERVIGQRLVRMGEVVGIVGDVRQEGIESEPEPEAYIHYRQVTPAMASMIGNMSLVIRHQPDARGLPETMKSRLGELDAELPLAHIQTMVDRLAESIARPRLYAWLMGGFSALAFAMALIGVYSVVSYGVDQRKRETGIRMALGASKTHVRRAVLSEGLALTAAGLFVGVGGSFVVTRAIERLLFGVEPFEPSILVAVTLLVLTTVLAATAIPASRAASENAVDALRHQ